MNIALYLVGCAILLGPVMLAGLMWHNWEVDKMQKWTETTNMPASREARQITKRFGMKPLRSLAGRDGLVIWARKCWLVETLSRVCCKREISRHVTKD